MVSRLRATTLVGMGTCTLAALLSSWSLLGPLAVEPPQTVTLREPPPPTPEQPPDTSDIVALTNLMADNQLRERQPPRHLVRKASPPDVRLVLTLVEPTQRSALLASANGDLHWCHAGEDLPSASRWSVVRIEPQNVVLQRDGMEATLELASGVGAR